MDYETMIGGIVIKKHLLYVIKQLLFHTIFTLVFDIEATIRIYNNIKEVRKSIIK
jgi:small basic protein